MSSSSSSSQVTSNSNCVGEMKNNIVSSSDETVTNASRNTSDEAEAPPVLPEIIFSILVCLPADILYHVMQHICRLWRSIIHSDAFVYQNLARSSSGLLVKDGYYSQGESHDFLEMREGSVVTTKLWFPFPCVISSSFNGLVLAVEKKSDAEEKSYHIYHLVNPLTKQTWTLPSLHRPSEPMARAAITYVASIRKYKVVRSYYDEDNTCVCAMLTVGVDKEWRQIKTNHIPSNIINVLYSIPKSTPGAFYWAENLYPYVLKLDAETENFNLILYPVYQDRYSCHFAIMNDTLSLITSCSTYSWNVWVLRGSSTKDWVKLHHINLECEPHVSNLARLVNEDRITDTLYPSNWMMNGELLMFNLELNSKKCIVYNVKTKELTAYEQESETSYNNSLQHVNSLVSLSLA